MIKNIVFDLGNVIMNFDPLSYLQNRYKDEKIVEDIYKIVFKSKEWPLLDRGLISEEEAFNNFIEENPQYHTILTEVLKEWHDILTPIEDTIDIVRKLKKKGYKLYVLSNYHEKAYCSTLKKSSIFEEFDGTVISYEIHLLKPEREIYEHLLSKYKLLAEETLFIDDMMENIKGAKNTGMQTIIFEGASKLNDMLTKINIL